MEIGAVYSKYGGRAEYQIRRNELPCAESPIVRDLIGDCCELSVFEPRVFDTGVARNVIWTLYAAKAEMFRSKEKKASSEREAGWKRETRSSLGSDASYQIRARDLYYSELWIALPVKINTTSCARGIRSALAIGVIVSTATQCAISDKAWSIDTMYDPSIISPKILAVFITGTPWNIRAGSNADPNNDDDR